MLCCGKKQQNHAYTLFDEVIESVDNVSDLGIVTTTSAMYSVQYHSIASKTAKETNGIRRNFRIRVKKLFWPAFQHHVPSIVNYCLPVWNPILISDIAITLSQSLSRHQYIN